VNTLLHIDTAGPDALIGISQDLQVIASKQNNLSNTHGEFVQAGVEELCKEAGISLKDMDAIAVTMGPGSYTGLRVGLASAKGLAFALNKPLIGLSTLSLLAKAAIGHLIETKNDLLDDKQLQVFSMIDARRMEIFGAIYNSSLDYLAPEKAIILDEPLLHSLLTNGPLICIGSGVAKTKILTQHTDFHNKLPLFLDCSYSIDNMAALAVDKFKANDFEDLAYSGPAYLKDYYQKPLIK
jgi:tRNA threonylcarbamoyladenosine biosynthesis protein TsaB